MIKVLGYGSGNVKAITNIFKRLNTPCEVATNDHELVGAHHVILPGVGAFDQVMTLLSNSGMLGRLNRMVLDDKVPVLGVCVGMQVMALRSDEGRLPGLGWIEGAVTKLSDDKLVHKPKLPHMGWNSIAVQETHPVLDEVDLKRGFYFLHSYRFECTREDNVLATTQYGDEFTSAVVSENILGFQFHPEKSHANGIALFKNFARL